MLPLNDKNLAYSNLEDVVRLLSDENKEKIAEKGVTKVFEEAYNINSVYDALNKDPSNPAARGILAGSTGKGDYKTKKNDAEVRNAAESHLMIKEINLYRAITESPEALNELKNYIDEEYINKFSKDEEKLSDMVSL